MDHEVFLQAIAIEYRGQWKTMQIISNATSYNFIQLLSFFEGLPKLNVKYQLLIVKFLPAVKVWPWIEILTNRNTNIGKWKAR